MFCKRKGECLLIVICIITIFITGCGKKESDLEGNRWYVENYAPTSGYVANLGDMFLNSKTNDIYQLTSNGWELVGNITGTSGITPSIEISEDGYWVINGNKTKVKAKGIDGEPFTVEISKDGYWVINENKTKVKASGDDGKTPIIEIKGDNWYINGVDTGISAKGQDGVTPTIEIKEGNWYINGTDSGVRAEAEDGITPTIEIKDGKWYINGADSGIKAEGKDGVTPTIEIKSSNWYINGVDTGVRAEGKDGTKVEIKDGFWFLDGVNSGIKVSDYVCKRATELHSETCNSGAGCTVNNSAGSKIEYGNKTTTVDKLVSGDAFDCDVNGDGKFESTTERFYYVSDYYDTEAKSFNEGVAVLIYYSNVSEGVASATGDVGYGIKDETTNSGPINAGLHMPTATAWGNVYLLKANRQIVNQVGTALSANIAVSKYDYKGYAARLLTIQEIEKGCGTTSVSSTCEYLLEGTIYSQVVNRKNGYVIETLVQNNNAVVFGIYGGSDASTVFNGIAKNSTYYGVRPVIEVSKARIDY